MAGLRNLDLSFGRIEKSFPKQRQGSSRYGRRLLREIRLEFHKMGADLQRQTSEKNRKPYKQALGKSQNHNFQKQESRRRLFCECFSDPVNIRFAGLVFMQKNVDKWITFVDNLLIKPEITVENLWTSAKTRRF